ncbi:MAG: molybdopterin molybdotransferase MoeA [Dehalococcoidia bacterium]|nr:molybdopterin molybdotransferase MoeA [Dehalococcoidia bacterium]
MKPLAKLVEFDQALTAVQSAMNFVERVEAVPLDMAPGRVLAEDIVAADSTPPFDRASMDGYAVQAADIASVPATLEVTGELYAGSVAKKPLMAGQAVYITTGARLPQGADTVVMVEDTSRIGDSVNITHGWSKGSNILLRGSDIVAGEVVLKSGTLLAPARIGVLAAQGFGEVKVFASPVVAILTTGSEIVAPGGKLNDAQVYDINSHTLAAVIVQNGGIPRLLAIAADDRDGLKAALEQALASADMVVTSGGSSVGEKDYMPELLEEMGEVKFHGVRLKPGKPSAFAVVNGKPVLGMPGYPTSCLMNAYLLLAPAVRRMARLPEAKSHEVSAVTGEDLKGVPGRPLFLPVRLEAGQVFNVFKNAGAITSMARAEGYTVIPADADLPAGSAVRVILF